MLIQSRTLRSCRLNALDKVVDVDADGRIEVDADGARQLLAIATEYSLVEQQPKTKPETKDEAIEPEAKDEQPKAKGKKG